MRHFKDMPIKWKVVTISLATSGTALLIACSAFLIHDQVAFRRDRLRTARTVAQMIGDSTTAAITFNDREVAAKTLSVLAREETVCHATLYLKDNTVYARYRRPGTSCECKAPDVPRTGTFQCRNCMHVYEPVLLEGEPIGTLNICWSQHRVRVRLVQSATMVLVVLLLSQAAAWVFANVLQSRVSGPILDLTRTAARVSEKHDFSLRAARVGDDEIGALVKGFNAMLDQIQTRDRELVEYQSRLRSMANEVLLSEERERRRIATGLHDSICQLLWIASIRLRDLSKAMNSDASRDALTEVLDMIETSLKEARSSVFQLSPPALYDLGLGAALKSLAGAMHEQYGMNITVEGGDTELRGNEELSVFLYRAVRELLTNVYKYAGTKKAAVMLSASEDTIRVSVSDAGSGFNPVVPHHRNNSGGFGLFSIRERMHALGGNVIIESTPGHGTTVTLHVPLGRPTGDSAEPS